MKSSVATTRREREREAHRTQIMDAAEDVFGARGYGGVTVEDIAEKAGFAVGSIYNFFGGKQDLFDQVMVRIAQSRIDDIEQRIMSVPDRWEGFELFCTLWMEHHERHQAFLHMAMGTKMAGGSEGFARNDSGCELARLHHDRELEFFSAFAAMPDVRDFTPEECLCIFEGTARALLFQHGGRWFGARASQRRGRDLGARLFTLMEKIFRKQAIGKQG